VAHEPALNNRLGEALAHEGDRPLRNG
jgi:hypothetical protein